MTEQPRRILLALDLSPEGAAATQAAIDLARALETRVEGLFVEDREILNLAAHPLARQVDTMGGAARPIERAALERGLRVQAERARRALERAAARGGVRWSFRVVRGHLEETVRRSVTALDWVVLGQHVWTTGLGPSSLWVGAAGLIVTPRRGLRPKDPTRVLYDGSEPAKRALRVAFALAERGGRRLGVLLLASDEGERDRLQSEVVALLEPGHEEPSWGWISGSGELDAIRESLATGSPGLLVVPVGGRISDEALGRVITGLDFPLLCVH